MRWQTCSLGLLLVCLSACTAVQPSPPSPLPAATPVSVSTPVPGLQPAIDAGLSFLNAQYNRDLGLLQESPNIGAQRYFITNDNALAAYIFEQTGQDDLAINVREVMARYGPSTNNFIEAAWGGVIPWPPKHFEDPGSLITTIGEDEILTIRHEGTGYFYDWSAYANLACMAAVNEYNQGFIESARRLYEIQMSTFDGRGFADKAFYDRGDVYETLGVAWCVYAGALLKAPVHETALSVLLEQQDPATGGFHTHYRAAESRLADPNVETTSLALLALLTLSGKFTGN